jgi:hypothetical protein
MKRIQTIKRPSIALPCHRWTTFPPPFVSIRAGRASTPHFKLPPRAIEMVRGTHGQMEE